MKRANLKFSLIALAIGLVVVSCGGKSNAQQSTAMPETQTATKGGDLSKAGKEKLASFGKTEKDKQIVAYREWEKANSYEVVVGMGEGSDWGNEVYWFYFDTEKGRSEYERYIKNNQRSIRETSDDGLWIYTRQQGNATSWQELYDRFKNDGFIIIE